MRKRYGGVTALDGVDFACRRGSIHAVLGENGAGKSTLIKIVAGAVRPDGGVMEVDGQAVHFADPLDAVRHGFVCVFQELSLLPDLSVADNICITGPPGIGRVYQPPGAAPPRRGAVGASWLSRTSTRG